jgi:hypothetical protein
MALTDVVFTGNPPPGFTTPGSGATITFTASTAGSGATVTIGVTSTAISSVTATPVAQGSGYPPNATIYFNVAGGTGGIVKGTTDGSSVLTFNTTQVVAGSGYTAGTKATTVEFFGNPGTGSTTLFLPYQTAMTGSGAQVTFVASAGAITSVTAIPANAGSGYPANASFYLLLSGGTNGFVTATTNSSGTVSNFTTSPYGGAGYSSGTANTSVNFGNQPVNSGTITSITGIGAAGSLYPPLCGLYLLLAGGTGGIVYVTTDNSGGGGTSGKVVSYSATPIAVGSGYTSGTAATSIVAIASKGGTFLTNSEMSRGGASLKDVDISPTLFQNLCVEMSRGNGTLKDSSGNIPILELARGNIGTLSEMVAGQRPCVELLNSNWIIPNTSDVRIGVTYGNNNANTGTLIVGGTTSGAATLTKITGSQAYGGSGTCAQLTPTSITAFGYWYFYLPVTSGSTFAFSFYHNISTNWNGILNVTVYDCNLETTPSILFSQTVTTINDGQYHQQLCSPTTPTDTGMSLIIIGIQNGSTSGYVLIDNIGTM